MSQIIIDHNPSEEKLKELGYLPVGHQPTTLFGKVTEAALKAFQKANNLPPNGQLTVDTRTVLNGGTVETAPSPAPAPVSVSGEFKSLLKRGSIGDEVKMLQVKLQGMGFLPSNLTPNGIFGPATEKAVKAFQKAHGISSVGFIGPGTRAALNK